MTWQKYTDIIRFQPEEFSENPERYADMYFLRQLDAFAIELQAPVFPSPVDGALARFSGSTVSRHYAINRQSDACDIFCYCPVSKAWTTALKFFSGVGVYFDTCYRGGSWPMLHVDLRPHNLIWYRDNGKYFYSGDEDFYPNLFNMLAKPVLMMVRP